VQIQDSHITLEVLDKDNLAELRGVIEGAPNTPYAGGKFVLAVGAAVLPALPAPFQS